MVLKSQKDRDDFKKAHPHGLHPQGYEHTKKRNRKRYAQSKYGAMTEEERDAHYAKTHPPKNPKLEAIKNMLPSASTEDSRARARAYYAHNKERKNKERRERELAKKNIMVLLQIDQISKNI